MPQHKCEKCGKIFGSKTDLTRHNKKKYPCIFLHNLKEHPAQNIIISSIKKIDNNVIDIFINEEIKKIKFNLENDLLNYVFNNLEKNKKFEMLYADIVKKIFDKFEYLCHKKEYNLFDDNGVIKSNEIIKNKLLNIFKDNENYFCKRLLKYAKNVALDIYDVKYIDIED
jgi:hypothetical protein